MKPLLHLFLSIAGFGGAGAIAYFLDPRAVDLIGFGIFYFALAIGSFNLFLLLRLTGLQAFLLTLLLLSFLVLQQMRLFTFWTGLGLVVITIVLEQYLGGR